MENNQTTDNRNVENAYRVIKTHPPHLIKNEKAYSHHLMKSEKGKAAKAENYLHLKY